MTLDCINVNGKIYSAHFSAGTQQCGIDPESKEVLTTFIAGGIEAEEGQFPWMVHLRVRKPGESKADICGGVLVSRRCVVTAAHCVDGYGSRTDI